MSAAAAIRELFPIKLVGGFIAVDEHVGCLGCNFCLSRRHPIWRSVFEAGAHLGGALGDPAAASDLLLRMRPFTEARVPVRFGHNTDASYQWEFGAALYKRLQAENPFIFMTRFALEQERLLLFRGQSNLLAKISITPPSRFLSPLVDPALVLRSWLDAPPENVYFLIGPIAADSVAKARELLRSLPSGAWADVKPLTRQGIESMAEVPLPSEREIEDLRTEGRDRGLVMTDFFGCRLRPRLGRGFYKTDGVPAYMTEVCRQCDARERCFSPHGSGIEDEIRVDAANIGLDLGRASRLGPRTTRFECPVPASRGDETFLSELHDHRVLLSSVPEGSQGGSFCIEDEAVLRRWEKAGMFPAREVQAAAERLHSRVMDLR